MSFRWGHGESYEGYVGRWSRLVAVEFLSWLGVTSGVRWLDVGCGTGALTEAILQHTNPSGVVGIDPAEGFVEFARRKSEEPRARFVVGDAQELPFESDSFDAVVSGLVLNFVADRRRAASEAARVTHGGGTCGAYVWDYAEGMQMLRYFWDAAVRLDPGAVELDEGRRFDTTPESLEQLFSEAGLKDVETRAIDVPTVFKDFDDYWTPFLSGQAPAPEYVASLDDKRRVRLRKTLHDRLPVQEDGTIRLNARAWAVKGIA